MSTQTRKQAGERRNSTPAWALNDELLRDLIVRFLENRARIKPGTGTLAERRARAEQALLRQKTHANFILDGLCKRYVALKETNSAEHAELLKLQRAIENLDTCLRMADHCAAIIATVVYLYYRTGLDSVGVGLQLHLKPPHVRQLLWRLNQVADYKKDSYHRTGHPTGRPKLVGHRHSNSNPMPGPQRAEMIAASRTVLIDRVDLIYADEMRLACKSWQEIGEEFGVPAETVKSVFLMAGIPTDAWRKGWEYEGKEDQL